MEDEIDGLKEKLKELDKKITESDEYRWKLSRLYDAGLIDSGREPKESNNEMN